MTTSYGTCGNCGTGLVLRVSHSDKNPNREYITCPKFCKGSFRWKDQQYGARKPKTPNKPKQLTFNKELFTASVSSFILPAEPTTQTNEIPSEIPSEGGVVGKMEGGTGADESALSFLSADKVATERIEFGKSESKEIVPSSYQKDIYGFVENGSTNATVNAVAGSGKTTTLVGALEFTSERARVGFIAFNRHIVQELQQRAPDHVHVSTVHSLGLANLKQSNSGVRVEKHKLYNLWSEVDPYDQYPELKPVCARLVDLCKSTMCEPTPENIRSLIDFYDIDVDGDLDIVLERVPKLFQLSLQNISEIDFTDMVYLTAAGRVPAKKFDYLFIDETQDFSPMQFALAKNSLAEGGRILAVGDEKQCQPAGTMISLTGGDSIPIESVKVGDEIVSYSRDDSFFVGRINQGRKVEAVSKRKIDEGWMYEISADNKKTRCTPNHKWLVRFTDRLPDKYVTYVMRRGARYRVGWCQLFDSHNGLHLGARARIEHADAAWIISVHSNKADASIQESILSAKYGIPTATFEPIYGANLYTRENLNKIFSELESGLEDNVRLLLDDFGRDIAYPFYKNLDGSRRGRTSLFITETCNLISGLMSIPSYCGEAKATWCPITVNRTWGRNQIVYSLQVQTHETYVADGLLTHNSIYGFGGAGIDSMEQAREMFGGEVLPLTICYRCPKKVVRLAQQIVPEIQWRDDAPEGIVDTVSDLNRAQSGDMILCRLNAPLVKPYFNLIRNGVRAVIRGRDVGDGLSSMLMRGEKKAGTGEIVAVLRALEEYVNKEVAKLISANKYPRALSLQDQFDTIVALAEDDEVKTAGGIRRKIAEIFSDTRAPITLSSVHRAKGLESKRVFILHPELLPYKRASLDWQIQQEWNVKYIALTRTKEELYFVEGNGL